MIHLFSLIDLVPSLKKIIQSLLLVQMLKSSTFLLLFQSYLPEKLKKEMSFLPFEPSLSL